MGRGEMTDAEKETLLLEETRQEVAALQASVDECLAEVKKTTAIIASRSRPLHREDWIMEKLDRDLAWARPYVDEARGAVARRGVISGGRVPKTPRRTAFGA